MNERIDKENWDEYFIPGTDVLVNKLGITNKEELKEIEKIITRKTLAKLYLKPVMENFDINHLSEIHKRIFESIYPFAGKFRTCSLQKDNHVFCSPVMIEENLNSILKRMNEEFNDSISSVAEFAFKLGKYYYELITIHPFREGNGRSIRVFIREFVLDKSRNLSFGPLDLDYTRINSKNLLLGTAARYIYPSHIEMEFMNGLVHIEKNNDKRRRKFLD